MTIAVNYPLHWPEGWPRTPTPKRSPFSRDRTMAQTRQFLLGELGRLGATRVDISSNVQVMANGMPRSGQGQPADRGVAVYFRIDDAEHVLALDKFDRVECNMRAIGLHVEAMRAMVRYGVGSRQQALRGYQLLLPAQGSVEGPPPRPWWEVLGVGQFASYVDIKRAYHELLQTKHPDRGAPRAEYEELVAAWDAARKMKGH